jgi:hypothetical protein
MDDIDAVPIPLVPKTDASTSRLTVTRENPKYKDIVIPVDVSVKDPDVGKLPFCTIPIRIVSSETGKDDVTAAAAEAGNKIDLQSLPMSSSRSLSSQSITSQSTRSIFGARNPMENYSFRGTKLTSSATTLGLRLASLSKMAGPDAHQHQHPAIYDDMFSLHSYETKNSQQASASKATFTELLNKKSNDISEVNADWPAHQIHSRMMGWKLTSPERRKNLLHLLEHANLSTASMTEDELRQHKRAREDRDHERIKHIAKRQSEAYEQTIR